MPKRRRIAGLEAIEFAASASAPVVVCFHGYGADAADLAPLAQEVELAGPARWVFPQGPLRLDGGGWAWFPIQSREIEQVQSSGTPLDWSKAKAEIMGPSLKACAEFLEALECPRDRMILGGFSQGAVLALELALAAVPAPLGLFLLSGTLVDEEAVRLRASALAGLSFFQSHGRSDPLLGYAQAQLLNDILTAAGLKGDFLSFEGGHELPRQALERLGRYIDQL